MVKKSRQELRADFITQVMAKDRGSVLDAMLVTDAIVRFVETGEIVGLSPGDDERAPLPKRRPRNTRSSTK